MASRVCCRQACRSTIPNTGCRSPTFSTKSTKRFLATAIRYSSSIATAFELIGVSASFTIRSQSAVQDLMMRSKNPKIAVLMSAGPGQINWTSSDFGGSVFARFLQVGLEGAADTEFAGDKDDDIGLQELASYLQHKVVGLV